MPKNRICPRPPISLPNLLSGAVALAVLSTANAVTAPVSAPTVPSPVVSTATSPSTTSSRDAVRLLDQAAFGPNDATVADVVGRGAAAWIDSQLALPATGYPALAYVDAASSVGCPTGSYSKCLRDRYSAFPVQLAFFRNAVGGPDQLRQRVALAYSQIFVTSNTDVKPAYAIREYQQMLLDNAFGNYRDLLQKVTLSPVMGDYLDLVNNDKPNPVTGLQANENYAREMMQLFSIGLVTLNPDGTAFRNAQGATVPAFDLPTVQATARALTGWTYAPAGGGAPAWNGPRNYLGTMVAVDAHHDTDAKLIVGNRTLPAGQAAQKDLADTLDAVFKHPNVGPFVGRQLIQFLVTSNPAPAYVARVAAVFNNNGRNVRGDMKAVIRAILLDSEARGDTKTDPGFGKLREPAVYAASIARAFNARTDGVYLHQVSNLMGQVLFSADSVFSFYSPDDPLPKSTSLVAPQFGVINLTTMVARLNFAGRLMLQKLGVSADPSVVGSTGDQLDFGAYKPNAATPSVMVDQLDAALTHSTLSSTDKNAIVAAVNTIPVYDVEARARAAAYLVVTSPSYQINR